jgi:glycosyltransferase involved in cell wall biosynthesis
MTIRKKKPEVLFVINDILGGVAYFNRNIINHSSLRSNAYVRVILISQIDSNVNRLTDLFKADQVLNFEYSSYENKHSVLKRLHERIGNEPGAIICNDGLEMEAIYKLGTNKTVYQIIHDFYNLRLAVKFERIVDVYLAHTRLFRDVLLSADPINIQAYHLFHGVTVGKYPIRPKNNGAIKIIFVGRLVEAKGVQDLFKINEILNKRGVHVEWMIVGQGPLKELLLEQWKDEKNITFSTPKTNEEVLQLMSKHDLFILPTRFEGSPVTILEALSTGLPPIVSNLPGGITEIVIDSIGRRIDVGNNLKFAEAIEEFHYDRELLQKLTVNCISMAVENFDVEKTSDNYFDFFLRFLEYKKDHPNLPPLPIGFRLDKSWLPNVIVKFLRIMVVKLNNRKKSNE